MGRGVKSASEAAESSKRRARMKAEKAKARTEKRPAWLPEGWIMKVRVGPGGRKVKQYTSPGSRQTFHSKQEVLGYLEAASFSVCNESTGKTEAINPPEWLPSGWTLAIKTHSSGRKAGKKYKCYIDPISGSRFYSKPQVLHFIKSGNNNVSTSGETRCLEASTTDNPPISVEEPILLGSTARQILLTKESSASEGERQMETGGLPDKLCLPPEEYALSESIQKPDAAPSLDVERQEGKSDKKRSRGLEAATDGSLDTSKHGEHEANMVRPINRSSRSEKENKGSEVLLEPAIVIEKSLEMTHEVTPVPRERKVRKSKMTSLTLPRRSSKRLAGLEPLEGTSDEDRRRGFEAAIDGSLKTSKHGEETPQRVRPTNNSSQLESENKGSEVLLEPTVVIEKPSQMTHEVTPVPQERKQQKRKAKSLMLPRRSSKRLAGLEPCPITDLVIHHPSFQSTSNSMCNGIEESVPLSEPEKMDNVESTHQTVSDGIEELVPLSEPEKMDTVKSPRRPLSNGIEESVPLSESEKMNAVEVTCWPLSNGIEESVPLVPLSEPEKMDIVGVTHQPLSNGTYNLTEESASLPMPKRVGFADETCQPLSNVVLNGIEAAASLPQPGEVEAGEKISGPLSNGLCNGIGESIALTEPARIGTAEAASLGGQALSGGQTSEDGPLSHFLSFRNAWSDPCIEFAVKTLMGEIPVLDEGLAIEEYVQKQLSSVKASNPRPPATIGPSDVWGLDSAKELGPVETLKKQHLPVGGEGKQFPLEKGLPSRAEASKLKVRFL